MGKLIGVIGGMGPLASSYFYSEITKRTAATKDADHLRLVIDSNPQIHDRTDSVLNNNTKALEGIIGSIDQLSNYSPSCIAIICNSAYNYFDEIQNASPFPVVDLIELTSLKIQELDINENIQVLGTKALATNNIYGTKFEKLSIEYSYPSDTSQGIIHDYIYEIKAGADLESILNKLVVQIETESKEAQTKNAYLLACTELSVISKQLKEALPALIFIDPIDFLIDFLIEEYAISM